MLADDTVRQQLEGFTRVKLDLTDNTPDQRQWLEAKGLFGPPAFVFYDSAGDELLELRIQGEIDRDGFLARTAAITGK